MSDIQSLGKWANNGELMADVAALGFVPSPVLDLTYGVGAFWDKYLPSEFVSNDLLRPLAATHYDFRATPFESGSFATVVFDPPYKLGGTPASPDMDDRFGTDVVRSRSEVLSLLVGGIAEGARLASQFLLVKTMDQVNGGKGRWLTDVARDTALAMELRLVERFILEGGRPQPSGTRQVHARHAYSTLLVFGRK